MLRPGKTAALHQQVVVVLLLLSATLISADQRKNKGSAREVPLTTLFQVPIGPKRILALSDNMMTKVAPVSCTGMHKFIVPSCWFPAGLEGILQKQYLPLWRWQASEPGPAQESLHHQLARRCNRKAAPGAVSARTGDHNRACSWCSLRSGLPLSRTMLLHHCEVMLSLHRIWPEVFAPRVQMTERPQGTPAGDVYNAHQHRA